MSNYDILTDDDIEKKLLPCPYCGGKAKALFKEVNGFIVPKIQIKCENCHAKMEEPANLFFSAVRLLIDEWNTRGGK